MSKLARVLSLGLLATVALGGVAEAQYYAPPPGYPPPGYPPPGYAPPPPPPPRPYDGRYYDRPPGYRCDASYRTPYGERRHLICDLAEPKPVGVGCACPPPPPPPGYSPGPFLNGRTVR